MDPNILTDLPKPRLVNTFHVLHLKPQDFFCIHWCDLTEQFTMLRQRWDCFSKAVEDISTKFEGKIVLEEFSTDFLARCYMDKPVNGSKQT